jgi:hypothetical protein
MRLCTSQGTEMEEEPADEGLVAPVRRLATLLIDVRAVDADAEAHGPSRHAAPLRLGRYRDMCLPVLKSTSASGSLDRVTGIATPLSRQRAVKF